MTTTTWAAKDRLFTALAFLVFIVLLFGGWVFQSAMEARAYNRVTGRHVTTWDAMWVELRVQEGAKGTP